MPLLVRNTLSNTDRCTFCHAHVETLEHVFVECVAVKQLWAQLHSWIRPEIPETPPHKFSAEQIFFGFSERTVNFNCIHLLILLTKKFVYNNKCLRKTLQFQGLQQFIKNYYDIETVKGMACPNTK